MRIDLNCLVGTPRRRIIIICVFASKVNSFYEKNKIESAFSKLCFCKWLGLALSARSGRHKTAIVLPFGMLGRVGFQENALSQRTGNKPKNKKPRK